MICKLSEIVSPVFWDAHKKIRSGEVGECVEKGGRGSAKSSFCSVEVVLQLIKHPDCHAVVMRKIGNTLRTSVYAQICWAIAQLGLSSHFRCTVSPMECVYVKTGQKIMFFGMDDPGKLKSIKVPFGYIGIAWFEELDQFSGPEEVRNVEQSLFRGGPYSLVLKSFNPPAMARNWANQYALENKQGKLVQHSTYLTTPPEWLGPRFLSDAEHLRDTNDTAYRHEYLGEVVGSGTQVFENLRIERIADDRIKDFDQIANGVDWGWYPDPWAYNRLHYDSARRVLYIFDECTRRRTSNQDTAELVKSKLFRGRIMTDCNSNETVDEDFRRLIGVHPDDGVDVVKDKILDMEQVIADSAEEKSIADYNACGIRCRGAEKGPGSVRYSMKWLQSLSAIVIDPDRCPDTAKEFLEYEYERDKKTGEVQEGYPDAANHHIDAVRYATNPIWKRRGR